MKTNRETKRDVVHTAATACVASCRILAARVEQMKRKFLAELREKLEVPEKLFRLALNEAEALAWQTEYPHLVFPALAVEKIQGAAKWTARQRFIRRKNFVRAVSN